MANMEINHKKMENMDKNHESQNIIEMNGNDIMNNNRYGCLVNNQEKESDTKQSAGPLKGILKKLKE